jgi:outer membrane protein, heavy metal efflux system
MKRLGSLLILLAYPALGHAAPDTLSLDDAVTRALANTPQVAARNAGVEAAESLAQGAGRLPDPSAIVGIDNLPASGPDAWSTSRDFMTMRKVGLMQEFPAASRRRAERERAATDVQLARAELLVTQLDVARATADAWIRRGAATDALRALGALEADYRVGASAARGALRAGKASTIDALEAEAGLAKFRSRILQLQTESRQAELELERWIGADAHLPASVTPSFDELPIPAEELRKTAHLHASLAPFDMRIEAAREDAAIARAGRRPDWSAELSYAKRGPDYSDMASLEFRVDLPLFARNRQNPLIAARSAELRRAQAERDDELRMHEAELRQVLVAWEQAGARLAQYENEVIPLARERSRAALAGFRSGSGSLNSALQAFADESELFIERAQLVRERGSAWAYLRYTQAAELPSSPESNR